VTFLWTDVIAHGFCDMESTPGGVIVLVNRRMHRDWKSAASHRLRQKRYSAKAKGREGASGPSDEATPPADPAADAGMTPPFFSSPSSASSSASALGEGKSFSLTPYPPNAGEERRKGNHGTPPNASPSNCGTRVRHDEGGARVPPLRVQGDGDGERGASAARSGAGGGEGRLRRAQGRDGETSAAWFATVIDGMLKQRENVGTGERGNEETGNGKEEGEA